jgi:biotin synthase
VSDQALCFLAGANSIFSSDNGQMLTAAVPSPKYDADAHLMELLGLRAMEPFHAKRGHTRFPHPQPPQLKS